MRTKRSLRMLTLASLCTVLLASPGMVFGRTIYVDDDAPGRQDGSTWTAAFKYLQDALAVASAGDEIRVAQGQYRPDQGIWATPGNRGAAFRLVNGVAILGGFAGAAGADPDLRDPARFATILTGDLAGDDDPNDYKTLLDNSSHVVIAKGVSSSTILGGVTIAHGNTGDTGGGMYNEGGSPIVRDCTFLSNDAYESGSGVFNVNSNAVFEGCTFQANRSGDGNGGGMYSRDSNIRVEDSRFIRNRAGEGAGALCNDRGSTQAINCEFIENHGGEGAGAVENFQGDMVFFHCMFRANDASDGTGALWSSGELCLLHCTFADNHAEEHTGAVACTGGNAVIANCLFRRNTGDDQGAIFIQGTSVSLDQCTFYGNVATDGVAGGIYCHPGGCLTPESCIPAASLTARGCIFWANRALNEDDDDEEERLTGYAAQIGADPNRTTIEYSCIEGWTPERGGTGNIGADPLFVAPDQNDFHLQSRAGHWDTALQTWTPDDVTSPCIDAGDPTRSVEQEQFPNGGIVNMGVYGGTSEASKSWFGAEPCRTVNAADLNGDCRVDAEDYHLISLRWLQPAARHQ